MVKIKRALISVYNKNNLKDILKVFKKFNVDVISSGGTFKEIKKLGFKSKEVSSITGYPEILNGRVKTLHPNIHGGILSKRKNKTHKKNLRENNIPEIDIIIVNFYPFEKVLFKTKNENKIIENIDIGGPAMVRAAAKNFNDVVVITNTNQYKELINILKKNNCSTSIDYRKRMAQEAFSLTSHYDILISNYFDKFNKTNFPQRKFISLNLKEELRYGENPHQSSSLYSESEIGLIKLSGKQLSYNNYSDIFSSLKISRSLEKNVGCVIVKHGNPCGVSIEKNAINSFKSALNCDPISAFGGVVSFNFKVKENLARELNKIFLEVIVANGYESSAIKILKKKKNLRIIDASKLKIGNTQSITSNFNSFLVQNIDNKIFSNSNFKIVSKLKPSKQMLKNLIFAFNVCRFVKSNAIVLTNGKSTIGIGSGQPSRLDSCDIAIKKMKKFKNYKTNDDIIAASDAFFPFVDGIEKLVQSGIKAVIQPYGSIRDKEIISYANETKTILVFSKTRHFNH